MTTTAGLGRHAAGLIFRRDEPRGVRMKISSPSNASRTTAEGEDRAGWLGADHGGHELRAQSFRRDRDRGSIASASCARRRDHRRQHRTEGCDAADSSRSRDGRGPRHPRPFGRDRSRCGGTHPREDRRRRKARPRHHGKAGDRRRFEPGRPTPRRLSRMAARHVRVEARGARVGLREGAKPGIRSRMAARR